MVAKGIKKTPTKSIKDLRNSHRRQRSHGRPYRKSPIKNAAATASAAVVATINKSICTCHRRLIKIFSRLAGIGTPKRKSPRKHGYQSLSKVSDEPEPQSLCRSLFNCDDDSRRPPLEPTTKKTIFLDLDETLVHSYLDCPPDRFDFTVSPVIEGERVVFFVTKRPFVDEFLDALSRKFDIVVFTAGLKEYASLVLGKLDTRSVISHRLYRDSCKLVDGKFVKDLSMLGRDLKSVVIVDDNPNSYALQPDNGVPIRPFTGEACDYELSRLIEFFDRTDRFEDMRDAIKQFFVDEGANQTEIVEQETSNCI